MDKRLRMRRVMLGIVPVVLALTMVTSFADSSSQAASGAQEHRFDVLLRHGTVFDGSGAPRYDADVGVKNGHITAVGDLGGASASREIDAEGLYLAPGFINMHSHADTDELSRAKNVLTQGITTEFLYPDGGGSIDPWEQVEQLENEGLAVNIASYIGFGAVWSEVVGQEDRSPTDAETKQMREMVERALEEGAWGVTTNLDAAPQTYTSTQEVLDVVRGAAGWRANYQSHLRSEGTTVIEALEEAIEIGEGAGLVPLWTHAKAEGPPNWGKTVDALQLVEDAADRGTYVAGDVYPYIFGSSRLARRFIPRWAAEGGLDAMLERFADPELRPRIAEESEELIEIRLGGPENILLREGEYIGQYLDEIANEMGVRPGEAVMRLVEQHGSDLSMNYWYGNEDDVIRLIQHPTIAAGCDCGATVSESTHPRNYGAFPKFLGEYVRERELVTMEEMIRKMTGLPATQMGLTERGFIAEGMAADISVFDPATITDHATTEEPKQYSEGMEYVLVNGRLALDEGETTEEEPGQALWKATDMPSRPQSSDENVSVSASGPVIVDDAEGRGKRLVNVSFSVNQGDNGPTEASGSFEFVDRRTQERLESVSIGQVQATDHWPDFAGVGGDWASFTGTARWSSGEEVPFTVSVEERDPFHPNEKPTVTIRVGDEGPISGPVHPARSVDVGIE